MDNLIVTQNNLPATFEDLAKFVLVGRDKLQAVRAEISAMQNLSLAKEVREQKLAEGQEIGKLVLLAEARLGELFNQMPKQQGGDRRSESFKLPPAGKFENTEPDVEKPKPKLEVAAEMGFNKNQVAQFQKLADNPKAVREAIDYAERNNTIATRTIALQKAKNLEHKEEIQRQCEEIEKGVEQLTGLFDVIVIDPPWGYKIQVNHGSYDANGQRCASPYPELTTDDLKAIELPAADNCVLCLWTTHKFIWDAKELLDYWGFKYRCMFVWDKMNLGMGRLIRLQCEFCLIGIKGSPVFKDVHDIRDLITEERREHSRKPESFYQIVDKIFTGRKLDYFSRQPRQGWCSYGSDVQKFGFEMALPIVN